MECTGTTRVSPTSILPAIRRTEKGALLSNLVAQNRERVARRLKITKAIYTQNAIVYARKALCVMTSRCRGMLQRRSRFDGSPPLFDDADCGALQPKRTRKAHPLSARFRVVSRIPLPCSPRHPSRTVTEKTVDRSIPDPRRCSARTRSATSFTPPEHLLDVMLSVVVSSLHRNVLLQQSLPLPCIWILLQMDRSLSAVACYEG